MVIDVCVYFIYTFGVSKYAPSSLDATLVALWLMKKCLNLVSRSTLPVILSCVFVEFSRVLIQVNHSRKPIFDKLQTLAFPQSNGNDYFAFVHHKAVASATGSDAALSSGWAIYDFEAEMARQGIPDQDWRICRLNENYELAPTYPALMAVPATQSDEDVAKVAAFRSKARLPALSWRSPRKPQRALNLV